MESRLVWWSNRKNWDELSILFPITTIQYMVQGFVLLQLYHEFIVFSYGLVTHICQDWVSGTVAIFTFCSKNKIFRIAIQTIFILG